MDKKDVTHDKRNLVLKKGVEFECVDRFCYLGDMISAGGGADFFIPNKSEMCLE